MKVIRFRYAVPGYGAGEIAGFEDAIAERMVQECLAEPYSIPAAEDSSEEKARKGPPAHTMLTGHQTVRKDVRKDAGPDRGQEPGSAQPKEPPKRKASLFTEGET